MDIFDIRLIREVDCDTQRIAVDRIYRRYIDRVVVDLGDNTFSDCIRASC